MPHPRDEDAYPIDTVVRITKVGKNYGLFAKIIGRAFQKDGKGFLHYEAHIEGYEYKRNQHTALYHDDIELESLPK